MDPNETLKRGRTAAQAVNDAPNLVEMEHEAETLAEAFVSLDEWITKGGFLPKPWEPPMTTMDVDAGRAIRRLETAFDRALRDDERLDRFFGRTAHWEEREQVIRLLSRAVVETVEQERQAVERMLQSGATRLFLDNLRAALADGT